MMARIDGSRHGRHHFHRGGRADQTMMTFKKLARFVRRWGAPRVVVKNPERYLSAHARRRLQEATHG